MQELSVYTAILSFCSAKSTRSYCCLC